jgi:hypothetical protein
MTSRTAVSRVYSAVSLFALLSFAGAAASAQTWTGAVDDNFNNSANWNPSTVPNSSGASVIINSATNNPVTLTGSVDIGTLQLGGAESLQLGGNTLNVFGGSIVNNGLIGTNDGTLTIFNSNLVLSGGGTVSMVGNQYINQASGGLTLTNQDNLIEGTGQLGQNGLSLDNQASGTVNANTNGGLLYLNGGGSVSNAGTLEASNGGFLQINNTVTNSTTGNITANGGTVYFNAAINGGTLNTQGTGVIQNIGNSTLNGVTISANSTYTAAGQNYLEGTIVNHGTITSPDGNLTIANGDVTLNGGGTVTMQSDTFINQASGGLTLHNVDNLIQGTGQLGQNGMAFDNQAAGVVNANVSGGVLYLNGGGTVTNANLLEATGGGILQINNAVTNTGANITANAGTVYTDSTITGGTLNSLAGGVLQNIGTTSLVDVTLSQNSAYDAAGQIFLYGTLTNKGTVTSPNGTTTIAGGDVTLTGGGTVTMQSDAFFNQNSGGLTLHNVNNLIQGSGQLGQNGMAFDNQSAGVVNANVTGGTLYLNGGGTVTNAGLLEATNGGILQLNNTVLNSTNINADGGTVYTADTISGGTLNVMNGGLMQNIGNTSLVNVTLSQNSAYDASGQIFLYNTLINKGTVTSPDGTITIAGGDLTLSGGGTVTMQSDAFFNQNSGGLTLHNVDNLIQGSGQLGQNGMALDNQAAGVVNANVNGVYLYLNGGGTVTNAGLIEATNGGILQINNTVNNTSAINADGGTVYTASQINGGTLNVLHGGVMLNVGNSVLNGVTLSANSAFGAGGQLFLENTITNNGTITTNDGTITIEGGDLTLQGTGTIVMQSNAYFNQASGGLTLHNDGNTIEGTGQLGQNGMSIDNQGSGTIFANVSGGTLYINGGGGLANAGTIHVGNGSDLNIQTTLNQSAGLTVIDAGGTLDAPAVNISGGALKVDGTLDPASIDILPLGILEGTGLIDGEVTSHGTTILGDDTGHPGTLSINGDYFSDGTLDEIFNSGGANGTLDVSGAVNLGGDIQVFLNGLFLNPGQTYTFDLIQGYTSESISSGIVLPNYWSLELGNDQIDLVYNNPNVVVSSTPEPSAWMDIAFLAVLALAAPLFRKKVATVVAL